MVNKILLEFEKGGQVIASLMEDKAPETCKAVWVALPIERPVLHAMYAGEEIFFQQYPTTAIIEPENDTSNVKPGDLGFHIGFKAITVFYGKSEPRSDLHTTERVNIFGKVHQIEKMIDIGKRIRVHGTEKMRMSRINP